LQHKEAKSFCEWKTHFQTFDNVEDQGMPGILFETDT